MTKEQIDALEEWIVSIIREQDRASDLQDAVRRYRLRDEVEVAFGLKEQTDD